jgi:hypothetical protein
MLRWLAVVVSGAALAASASAARPLQDQRIGHVSVDTGAPLVGHVFGPWTFPSARLDVSPLMADARAAVAEAPDAFAAARALDDLVRTSYPTGSTCDFLASAVFRLGQANGLPLRLVVGSANLYTWAYDSHTTVEVWLAAERRWVIADPTYDGYLTEGRDGRRLGAFDIDALMHEGRGDTIYWHGSHVKNASLPSDSWLDFRAYFRSVAVVGVDGDTWYYLVHDPRRAVDVGSHLARATSSVAAAPHVAIRGSLTTRPKLPPLTRPTGKLLWSGELSLARGRRTPLPKVDARATYAVASGPFVLGTTAYPAGTNRYVSEAVFTRHATITGVGSPERVKLELYSVPEFPADHEVG